jgi:hypothetical protein
LNAILWTKPLLYAKEKRTTLINERYLVLVRRVMYMIRGPMKRENMKHFNSKTQVVSLSKTLIPQP